MYASRPASGLRSAVGTLSGCFLIGNDNVVHACMCMLAGEVGGREWASWGYVEEGLQASLGGFTGRPLTSCVYVCLFT